MTHEMIFLSSFNERRELLGLGLPDVGLRLEGNNCLLHLYEKVGITFLKI